MINLINSSFPLAPIRAIRKKLNFIQNSSLIFNKNFCPYDMGTGHTLSGHHEWRQGERKVSSNACSAHLNHGG